MPRWISCQGVWLSGILKPPRFRERLLAALVLRLADQDIGGALVEIDANPIAGLQDREAAARRRFRATR